MPELIPAEPGTPDWLAARRLGVTATGTVGEIVSDGDTNAIGRQR